MSDTPTPRTDAAVDHMCINPNLPHGIPMVHAELARQLERELAEANRLVNHWQDQHTHATECHGQTIRELADAREHLDRLKEAGARLMRVIESQPTSHKADVRLSLDLACIEMLQALAAVNHPTNEQQ